jgi:hypothetical protein
MIKSLLVVLTLGAMGAQALGLQHATFRSQSTQGPTWIGTAEISREQCHITVFPDYLDVELEWEFGVGGTRPEQYGDALEIVGNLNLAQNASMIGMLVWYKDKILKAKLKAGATARREYEQVVDRNSTVPPRPRDPVLLEWIDKDNYDISIFPVAWGSTRKVRFRYLVPMAAGSAVYPHAFSSAGKATIVPGPGTRGFQLELSDRTRRDFVARADLASPDFQLQAYAGPVQPVSISPILEDSLASSRLLIGAFTGLSFAGQMVHAYLVPPAAIRNRISEDTTAKWALQAILRSGQDSCPVPYPIRNGKLAAFADVRMYGKLPIQGSITWRLARAGVPALEVAETPVISEAQDGIQFARAFGTAPFFPMAPTMPASLGAALGLIDGKYALVALEEDALDATLRARYASQGVPALDAAEIKVADGEDFAVPVDTWIAKRGQTRTGLAMPGYKSFGNDWVLTSLQPRNGLPEGVRMEVRGSRLFLELPPAMRRDARGLRIEVCDMRGMILKSWSGEECRSGFLSWSPAEAGRASGVYLLRMRTAAGTYLARFVIA